MKYSKPIFLVSLFLLISSKNTRAQQDSVVFSAKIEQIGIPSFIFKDRIQVLVEEFEANRVQKPETAQSQRAELSEEDKTVLSRIADIYRLHVLSLESQLNDDALSTEKYISSSINEMQAMLDENPDVQQHRRFAELYRTIITEYREFYGTSDSGLEEDGEIFAIHNELFSDDELESELDADNFSLPNLPANKIKFQVPLTQNKYVNNQLAYLLIRRPEIMETWLQRKEKYFPMIEKIFEEEKVPKELMHLAMIESGLNPSARSKAAAVGMWQFIKATGSVYGLEVNWWVDDRRDPVKATRAAARHLNDLYKIWGDWHLALANYNVSPRRMKYAIRQSNGVKDYWVIYPHLPRETRGYVPSFIATTMIATNPVEFGFEAKYGEKPFTFETVDVVGSYDLSVLAACAGISLDEIKEYNTALIRFATPPGNAPYELKLPVGTKETFLANFKNVPASTRIEQIYVHQVKRGETLGKIAHKYGVSIRDLYDSNDKLGKVIRVNQEIVIPIPAGKSVPILADIKKSSSSKSGKTTIEEETPSNSVKLVYTVKSGDTIGQIAEWYSTSISNVKNWNGIGNLIRVGQKLAIYVPKSRVDDFELVNSMSTKEKNEFKRQKSGSRNLASSTTSSADGYVTYKVKSNDNLFDIAASTGTTVNQIKQLNNLKRNTIYPGQVLKIKAK